MKLETFMVEGVVLVEALKEVEKNDRTAVDYVAGVNELLNEVEEILEDYDHYLDMYLVPVGDLKQKPTGNNFRKYMVVVGYAIHKAEVEIELGEKNLTEFDKETEVDHDTYGELEPIMDHFNLKDADAKTLLLEGYAVGKDDEVTLDLLTK